MQATVTLSKFEISVTYYSLTEHRIKKNNKRALLPFYYLK